MTFLTPEDELETYNELNKYYEIADNLSEKVSESVELSIKQKQDILYPIIDEIKEYANIMIENYILYLKNHILFVLLYLYISLLSPPYKYYFITCFLFCQQLILLSFN